jgi:hypothetical protein
MTAVTTVLVIAGDPGSEQLPHDVADVAFCGAGLCNLLGGVGESGLPFSYRPGAV